MLDNETWHCCHGHGHAVTYHDLHVPHPLYCRYIARKYGLNGASEQENVSGSWCMVKLVDINHDSASIGQGSPWEQPTVELPAACYTTLDA